MKKKEILREKIREETKEWYNQQSLFISEINNLKKSDQQENFLKTQESKLQLKEKVLKKHLKHDQKLEKLRETQQKLSKIKANIESEISIKRDKNLLSIKESAGNLQRLSRKPKKTDESLILSDDTN